MIFRDVLLWTAYFLCIIHNLFRDKERVKITITKQTNMMETEPLTRRIVIFSATGDLCKRKLIPTL